MKTKTNSKPFATARISKRLPRGGRYAYRVGWSYRLPGGRVCNGHGGEKLFSTREDAELAKAVGLGIVAAFGAFYGEGR